jgi:hypothetical protein
LEQIATPGLRAYIASVNLALTSLAAAPDLKKLATWNWIGIGITLSTARNSLSTKLSALKHRINKH